MNAEGKNNILTLFRRWLSGDVRRAEEAKLEQLAADDPFVAEAMEGYRNFPEADHARQVTQIKANLRKQYQKEERKGIFYLYRAAAVAAFVVIALGGMWWIATPKMKEGIALQDKAEIEQPSAATEEAIEVLPSAEADEDAESDAGFVTPPTKEQKDTPARSEKSRDELAFKDDSPPAIASKKSKAEAPMTEETIAPPQPSPPPPPVEELALAEDEARDVGDNDTVNARLFPEQIAIAQGADSQISARERAAPVSPAKADNNDIPRVIRGTVTDGATGDPLIGASILVPGTSTGSITDFDGKYEITVPEGADEITVSYTGYTHQSVEIDQEQTVVDISLETGEVLDEVVVTGYAAERKQSAPPPIVARPVEGYKTLKEYIDAKLIYPEAAKNNHIEGKVKLRFKVFPNGELGEFEVVRSLGYGCDEEATRLLQNGPKWEVTGTNEAIKKTYTIRFKLPK